MRGNGREGSNVIGVSSQDRFVRFFHGMLREGVYLAPSAFETGFVSSAHDEQAIEATLEAAERVFSTLGTAIGD